MSRRWDEKYWLVWILRGGEKGRGGRKGGGVLEG